ncbi:alpha/beta fold hydrolase [Oceanobacillus chungangensis]|uniref:Alpha/beta hydrolase n=1 Tax=Oceanobacillus chungangensis TaxID=1229152 RepID=A0A3D8PXT4_9BACI|nr:alpha/beta hydrolase [Oceanobacillus chungangensis]RDW20903.1 alpha/beta hydrolase [Oceanobacillus chungangensis]
MGYYVKVEPTVNIFVEDVNPTSEKVILFVHGWPANHRLFEYQFNILPGQGYRCIGIDIRGFGKSDKPWDGYSYDRLADDIRYVVETLGLQNFTLAGHSVGGAIVIRYMARHHGYGVAKLALFAAAAPSFTEQPGFPYGLKKSDVDQLIQQTYQDRPQMLSNFTEMFFYQKLTKAFSDWFFQLGLEAAGYATVSLAISLRDETLFNDLGKVQVPTLILQGVHDRVCLPPIASALHQGIRNSKLVWFEKSGHGLFWEEKDKFNRELLNFIG